ncbi:hypothetical protein JJB07_10410 [Tumebacillus sp. ITR2]|uniref:Uncharacterized protein n=1 Tax=Tumebacillus amylolyticus TaxID=2801339 RepID=A0ABS1J9W0_9BACL|nr:hypothetical protein [Tumebacillus amylolyticus]MBL0387063.1 hypothetical protein [Tumebacillus amylolyticus]
MNFKKWKTRQWVILCVCLLVLVGSLVAYFLFIPKIYAIDSLQKQVQSAKAQRQILTSTPKPETPNDFQKKALALLVPAQLEQERFLQELHVGAKSSGANLISIAFYDPASEEGKKAPATQGTQTQPPAKPTAKTGATQLPMKTFSGKLSLQGDYKQVREFLEQFSTMSRLITYNNWTLKAEKQDITPGLKTSNGLTNSTVTGVGGTITGTTGTTTVSAANSTAQRVQTQLSVASLTPDEIRKQLTPEFANDKLLNDLTPIFTQTDFNRYEESIRATVPKLMTQQEKDVANLRIQQGFNRLTAGLTGKKQAESVFDQEFAQVFIPGTNAKIREVLGLKAPQTEGQTGNPQGNQTGSQTPSGPVPPPLIFVNLPDLSIQSNHIFKTVVSLDIDFTLYFAPNALDVLPAQPPIKTYDPTFRTNPVESL